MQSPMSEVSAGSNPDALAAPEPQPGATPSPGAALARARADKGLSLEDVAQRVKYSPRQIAALEADEYSKLSGMTFVRGMIRSYSKLLGIDPAPLLVELERREIPAQATVDLRAKRVPFPQQVPRSNRSYLILSGLFVLMAFAVILEWQTGIALWKLPIFEGDQRPVAAAPAPAGIPSSAPAQAVDRPDVATADPSTSATGTGTGPAAPSSQEPLVRKEPVSVPAAVGAVGQSGQASHVASAPGGGSGATSASPATIVLQFQRDSWVQIKQADGRILLSQMNRGGTEQLLDGRPPFDVVIGNAPSVRLLYKGQPYDLKPHYKVDVARLVLE